MVDPMTNFTRDPTLPHYRVRLSDRIWLLEFYIQQWWGRIVCAWRGRHKFSPFYPEGYCCRCGTYRPSDEDNVWDLPDWFRNRHGENDQ